jgi:transposase-like protein
VLAMANPVTADERAAILDTLRTTGNVSETARRHGRHKATISRIAKDEGVDVARTATAAATAVKRVDNAARRERIKELLAQRAEEFLESMDRPFLAFNFGGKDNTYNERLLGRAPTGDIRNLMVSAGIAVQRLVDLERLDGNPRDDEGRSMLGALADGLKAAYDALGDKPTEPEPQPAGG